MTTTIEKSDTKVVKKHSVCPKRVINIIVNLIKAGRSEFMYNLVKRALD